MKRSTTILRGVLFPVFLLFAGLLAGQATNASIGGVVQDAEGETLIGATVTIINNSTGFTTATITNLKGEYLIPQVPLGGPYDVTTTYIGFATTRQSGFTINQGDRLEVNFDLEPSANELDVIVVSGGDLRNRINQIGSTTEVSSAQIKNLPSEGRNFTRLTSLSPLQGGGSLNLGGQRRTSTNVTIDGMNARNQLTAGEVGRGPYTISQEAVREFEVSTNNYDVTEGRQGGGSISATTKSGTNEFEGSVFFFHRNDGLQSKYDIRGNERTSDFYNSQYGVSLGGPLIKDKLQFYTVYERQDAGEPVFIADLQTEDDENRTGITRENLDRFQEIARNLYGVSDDQQVGQFDRKTTANTWFVRLDYQLDDKNTLTLRNNWNKWDNPFSVSDNSSIELAETWSDFSSMENSTLLSLRTSFSPNLLNEFKLQYQHAERAFVPSSQLPASNIPRAIVDVNSVLPNGNSRTLSVQLGGQRFTPETNEENMIQIANTTYLSSGRFNFTFGTDNMITSLKTLLSNEQNGRFFFDSLEDFENMNPSRYAREVPLQGLPLVEQTVIDMSLFAQVEFDLAPNLNSVFGVRWDATSFSDAADFNQVVFDDLGIRTDNKPSDWDNIQPRFQLTYDHKGRSTDIVRLGGGVFSSQPHYYAQVNNIQNSGVLLGAIDVSGDAVPTPDFEGYREDPSTVPGVPEGASAFSTINAVSDDFEVPTIFKGNLSYTHIFDNRYSLGFNLLASRTVNNYTYQEANLVEDPFFTSGSDGRDVFVPAETITENGSTDWTESRISDRVGRTLLLTSDGELDQIALILEATAKIGKDGYLNASYTFNEAKDNSSYNCCVANTSTFLPVTGDPRALNRGISDNNFANKLIVNGATPSFAGFNLGFAVIGSGGSPYGFTVNSNRSANGDFNLRNDVAYIYDPADPNTPAGIRDAYNEILNNPEIPEHYKEYLQDNFGQFAERNGGKNPFRATVDLRAAYKITLPNTKHGLEITADLFNFANLLNKEWGVTNNYSRENRLMSITGFDQETESYIYSVNSGVANESINGTPWRLQMGVRYTFN
ncbi:TonB-dependent receptor [Neolewinella aurantiaca]|nr:carboxypeptidase-like regulatory domain-containing protein [Neolewinella aurantiaca]